MIVMGIGRLTGAIGLGNVSSSQVQTEESDASPDCDLQINTVQHGLTHASQSLRNHANTRTSTYHLLAPRPSLLWIEAVKVLVLGVWLEVFCQIGVVVYGGLRRGLLEQWVVLSHPE